VKSVHQKITGPSLLSKEANVIYFEAWRAASSGFFNYDKADAKSIIMAWCFSEGQTLNQLFVQLSWVVEDNLDGISSQ